MTGVPGSEKSSAFSSSMRRRLFSTQRREPAADADVDPHLRIGGVGLVHVVALLVGHHLERQLVVVAQEHRPLAVLGDVGRLVQDLDDRVAVFLPQRHEHARHQREVERHVALVAVAEVRRGRRPATGSPRRAACGSGSARRARAGSACRTACVSGRFSLLVPSRSNRYGTASSRSASTPQIEPELHHVDHRVDDGRVVEVEVGLVGEEAVPVVLAWRPGRSVQFDFSVSVKMMRVSGNFCVGVAPDVEVALRRAGGRVPRALEPRMLVRGVVDDQLGDHA